MGNSGEVVTTDEREACGLIAAIGYDPDYALYALEGVSEGVLLAFVGILFEPPNPFNETDPRHGERTQMLSRMGIREANRILWKRSR